MEIIIAQMPISQISGLSPYSVGLDREKRETQAN